jgi:hypothetical protein
MPRTLSDPGAATKLGRARAVARLTGIGHDAPMRTSAAGLVVLAALLAPAPPPEVVFSGFDLLGWLRAGAVSVRAPALSVGGPVALLDGDPRTVSLTGGSEAQFALEFHPAQMVRRVAIAPAADGSTRVTLTVIQQDGHRFAAGEQDVPPGGEAQFRLMDVGVAELRVDVERTDGLTGTGLADLFVDGRFELTSLALEGVPATVPEGGSFPVRIRGRDSLGGRPDLTDLATLVVQPAPALSIQGGRARTRVQGPVSLEARLGGLTAPMVPLLVTPLDPPPPAPSVLPGARVVQLRLHGAPPFEVFRRAAGEKQPVSLGRSLREDFYDDSVQPGAAYSYSARRVDLLGNQLTAVGPEARGRTHARPQPGEHELGRVPLLLALFDDSFAPGEREAVLASVSAARLFAWRHTLGRILIDPVVLDIAGPTPVTAGPTMAAVESRLRELGVAKDGFTLVAAVSREFDGDYSGFRVFDDAVGMLLRGTPVPTPHGMLGPEPGIAWSLLHELNHVAAGLVLDATGEQLPTGHPDQDFGALGLLGSAHGRPFDAGEAWDQAAMLLAVYDGWSRLGLPWVRPLEILDTDADGLPDADDRLPLDELRLGTDPTRADTDADGIADFTELASGLYRGSNPLSTDTDGDGIADALDPWPTSNFAGAIPSARVPHPLVSLPTLASPDAPPVAVAACWSRTALTLEIVTEEPCDIFLDLDGSGRLGRFESDANTGSYGAPIGDCWCGPQRLALRAHTAPLGVFLGGHLLHNALVTAEREPDGRHRVTAILPGSLGPGDPQGLVDPGAALTDGLRLRPGTVLGLGLTLRPSRRPEPTPFEAFPDDADWFSVFETHHLMDAVLRE